MAGVKIPDQMHEPSAIRTDALTAVGLISGFDAMFFAEMDEDVQ